MIHRRNLFAILLGLSMLALPASLRGVEEIVKFNDREEKRPDAQVSGTIIEETVQGIKIKPGGRGTAQLIPALDVIEVTYPPQGIVSKVDMGIPLSKESKIATAKPGDRAKQIEDTLTEYHTLIIRLENYKNPQTYFKYRLVQLLVRLAEEDPARVNEAMHELTTFKDENSSSWEYPGAMRLLARMQDVKGDHDGARKTYEEMAGRADLPVELRVTANVALVRALLRTQQLPLAEARVQDLVKLIPRESPESARVQVYQAELQMQKKADLGNAEKTLKSILGGPADDGVKAAASNALADYYLSVNKPKDAFWQYLWVDVLYNSDPEERARALYHLAKLFKDEMNDEAHALECRKRLLEDHQFTGLEYQRLAKEDKPK
jgi:hypothetical protein